MNAKVTNTEVNIPNLNTNSPDRVQVIDQITDGADCVQQKKVIAAVDRHIGEVLSPTTVAADLSSTSNEQQLPSTQLPIVSTISTNVPSEESQSTSDFSVYDYVVHVEKSTDSDKLLVQASKLVNGAYELLFDGAISAFMGDAGVSTNVLTRVTEVLEHVKAVVTNEEVTGAEQGKKPVEKEVDTEVSRGFCLSIPDFADLLISHNGDVVLDGKNVKTQGTSISISSPENVIVNNANLAGLSVAASSLLLDGQEDIRSIKFTSNLYSENSLHGLLIGENCELMAQEISLTDATLVNLGKLHIEKRLSLDNKFESTAGNIFNIGSIDTTDSALLDGIGYLFNDRCGSITSRTGINLSSVSLSNLGRIESDTINITTAKLLSNSCEIQSKKSLLLNSLEDAVNDGEINGGSGRVDILGNQFLHTREARLSSARVSLHSVNSELRGEVFGQEGFFLGDVKNYGAVNFQRGVLSKHFTNYAESIAFTSRTELDGDSVVFENVGKLITSELINNAKIGKIVGGQTTATRVNVNENTNFLLKSTAQDIKAVSIEHGAEFSAEDGTDLSSLERINNSGTATFNTHLLQLVNVVNKPKADLNFLKNVKLFARNATVDEEAFLKNIEHEAEQDSVGVVVDDDNQEKVGMNHDRSLRDMVGLYNEGSIFVRGCGEEISDNVLDTSKFGDTTRQGYNFDIEGTYIGTKDSILHLHGGARVIADYYANNGKISSSGKLEINQHHDIRKFGDVASGGNITYNFYGTILNLSSWFINPAISGLEKVFKICAEHTDIYATRDFNADVNMEVSAESMEMFSSKLTSNSLKLNLKEKFHNANGTLSSKEFIHLNANSFLNESGTLKCLNEITITIKDLLKNTSGVCIEKDVLEQLTLYKTVAVTKEDIQKQADNCWKNCDGKIFNAGFIRSRHAVMTHYGEIAVVKSDNNNLGSIIVEQAVRDVNSKKRNGPCNDNDPIAFVKLDKYSETVIHDIYHVESAKIGTVTCDGKMKITAGVFDNSFGVISSKNGISIESRQAVINECGVIHSCGETTINGSNLRNGYLKGQKEFISCDPKQPVSVGSSIHIWVEPRKVTVDKKNEHNEILATINTNIIVDYEKIPVYSTESRYPGFIFSEDKLQINTELEGYLGTIVSGKDIYLKGEKFSELNFKYQGHVIACGDVKAEMKTAQLEQLAIAAENVQVNVMSALVKLTLGSMKPSVLSQGAQQGLADQTKSLADGTNLTLSNLKYLLGSAKRPTEIDMSGFSAAKKSAQFCMQADTLERLKRIIVSMLSPKAANSAGEQSTNIEPIPTDQSNILSSMYQYNPWLFSELIKLLPNDVMIHAMKKAHIHSAGDVQVVPGNTGIKSNDMTITSDKHVEIGSEYKYSGTLARTEVNQVNLDVPGEVAVAGKEGVEVNAANLHGSSVQLNSESGNVVFNDMRLDPQTTVIDRNTYVVKQTSTVATIVADDKIEISAPNGVVDQRGTVMIAGEGGVVVQAKEHIMQPVVERARAVREQGRTYSEVVVQENKLPKIITNGTVVLDSPDTTLIGAEIVAKKVINNITGNCTVMPAVYTREAYSKTSSKKKMLGVTVSKSKMEVREHTEYANQPRIIADEFKSLGAGTLMLEGVFAKTASSEIRKTLIEKNAHVHNSSKVTKSSHGFFPSKLKTDPVISSLNGLKDVASKSLGDAAPAAMNAIGNVAQTWAHAITLKNIALNDNPMLAIANIILSRYTSCTLYSRMTQTTTREETIPVQSHIETGVLVISNDRTHLEGKWEVGTAKIETGELTTSSDKRVVEQKTEQKGFSISLSPAAIAMACLAPVGGTAATIISCLPSVGSQKGTANGRSEEVVPMTLTADELFIKCNDAVFSGSTIKAKMVHAIIENKLTIETLTDMFKSHSKSSDINVSLSSIFGAIRGKDAGDASKSLSTSDLAAVPGFRMANTQELNKRIDECAQFVGLEQFYLKVGETLYNKGAQIGLMEPDGHVVNGSNPNEKIEAGRVIEERVKEEHSKKSHVFNPSINEFATMMGHIDDLKRVRAQVAALKAHQKASAAEIAQADKEINEFFEQPEVKASYDKLNDAKNKLDDSTVKFVNELEQNPEIAARIASNLPKEADVHHEVDTNPESFLARLSQAWENAQAEVGSQEDKWSGEALDALFYIRSHKQETMAQIKHINAQWTTFEAEHPYMAAGVKGIVTAAAIEVLGVSGAACSIARTIYEGAKFFQKICKNDQPGGLVLVGADGGQQVGATSAAATATKPVDAKPILELSMANKSDGKGRTSKARPAEKPAKKEHIKRTLEDVKNYFKKLVEEGWKPKSKNGKKVYVNPKTGEIRYGDTLHYEIESFSPKSGDHTVIDPVTGYIIPGKCGKHPFPKWLK